MPGTWNAACYGPPLSQISALLAPLFPEFIADVLNIGATISSITIPTPIFGCVAPFSAYFRFYFYMALPALGLLFAVVLILVPLSFCHATAALRSSLPLLRSLLLHLSKLPLIPAL